MTNTTIGFFRHGQTDWNINLLLQGITDIPMNQTGIEQITRARKLLDASQWDHIITSPLDRARKTAEILNEQLALGRIHENELLIERSFGEAEGLSYDQWKLKYGNLDVIPGGESRSELEARSQKLLKELATKYSGKRILAVSHGALIRSVISIASDQTLPRDGERLSNASLNIVKHVDSSWQIIHYQLDPLDA